jgi:hypothetical protein
MSVVNRIALAPIKDSHFNANSQPNTPLKKRKSPAALLLGSSTPYAHKKFHIHKKTPQKSFSFSDFKANSLKSHNNDTAGLAATKLKLKLQLAIYKLQQNKSSSSSGKVSDKINIHYSSTYLTPPSSTTDCQGFVLPRDEIINSICQLPTPPPPSQMASEPSKPSYSGSANLNLKTKSHLKPTLETIVKNTNQKTCLKLFQIKKNSSFYHSSSRKLPLVDKPPKPLHVDNLQLKQKHTNSTYSSSNPFILPVEAQAANHPNPSIYLNPLYNNKSFEPQPAGNLPSINIILKTPIKHANSTRNLIPGNSVREKSFNLSMPHMGPNNHDDTTIDEDNDNTIANTTVNQDVLGSLPEEPTRRKSLILSSPIQNTFGTPNSFSVAKSLLQLGGYYR